MAELSSEILSKLDALIGRRDLQQRQLNDWMAGGVTGGPAGNGTFPLTSGDGQVLMLPSPAKAQAVGTTRGPEYFGAIGDGKSHQARYYFSTLAECQAVYPTAVSLAQEMDFLAWQKMIDTVGKYLCPPKRDYKMCNGDKESWVPLSWCAGIADVDVNYGFLDWSDLRAIYSDDHRIPNHDFRTADGWYNSSDYDNLPGWIIYANFTKGYAECIDDKAEIGARNPYYEFKHDVALPPGRWRCVMKAKATRGISYHYKNGNPPYATIHLSPSLGNRASTVFPQMDPVDPEGKEVEVSAQFDFQTTEPMSYGSIVFKGGGYVNFRVTDFDIVPFIANCAILNHRDGPVDHYFVSRRLRNVNLRGPDNQADARGLSGGLWKSFNSIDGSLQDWDSVKTAGWWEWPLNWSDGAYLLNYFGMDIGSGLSGCYFGPGSVNAGENIKFLYGSLSGGPVAFNNPGGAEFTLTGTIVDYNTQLLINNAGIFRLFGTRLEQIGVREADKPIIHCTTGKFHMFGSYMLLAGGIGTSPIPPIKLDTSNATAEFFGTQTYNLSSAAGVAASGNGRVVFHGWSNLGNANMGPDLISESRTMDILAGAGCFEPPATGTAFFIQNDPTGIDLVGGVYDSDGDGRMIDRWNSSFIKCSVVEGHARTGTRSLKITKLKGANNNVYSHVAIFVPVPRPGNIIGRCYMSFPDKIQDEPTLDEDGKLVQYPIYFRQFWVTVTRYDVLGRPIIGKSSQFKGEVDFYLDGTGDPTWQRRSLNTTYAPPDPSDASNERSPDWVTHYMIAIDIQNMPAMSIYLDDMKMNFLG